MVDVYEKDCSEPHCLVCGDGDGVGVGVGVWVLLGWVVSRTSEELDKNEIWEKWKKWKK